jgi:hypothetical protein
MAKTFIPQPAPSSFHPFDRLPVELQLRIIKYAWHNELCTHDRDITMTCKYRRENWGPILCFLNYELASNAILPSLRLVNKLFHAEHRFLAKPWLVNIAAPFARPKRTLFLPETDTLYLDNLHQVFLAPNIVDIFHKLAPALRTKVKHLCIRTDHRGSSGLHFAERRHGGVSTMVARFDAPLLENVTILGGFSAWDKTCMRDLQLPMMVMVVAREGKGSVEVVWA